MAYDAHLAERVRDAVPAGAVERPMFGGLGFMVDGHLTVALGLGDLMARVGAEAVSSALGQPGVSPCVMGRRTMKDWILVETAGLSQGDLSAWVERATSFVSTLPAR
jgi:TfoX/Sxy family transcriptional regulator of competence genes